MGKEKIEKLFSDYPAWQTIVFECFTPEFYEQRNLSLSFK